MGRGQSRPACGVFPRLVCGCRRSGSWGRSGRLSGRTCRRRAGGRGGSAGAGGGCALLLFGGVDRRGRKLLRGADAPCSEPSGQPGGAHTPYRRRRLIAVEEDQRAGTGEDVSALQGRKHAGQGGAQVVDVPGAVTDEAGGTFSSMVASSLGRIGLRSRRMRAWSVMTKASRASVFRTTSPAWP